MRLKLKGRTVTKLASLSAFGAGAVVVGVQDAEAGIILTPVNQVVGFDGADHISWTSALLGGSGAALQFFRTNTAVPSHKHSFNRSIKASMSGAGTLYWAKKVSTLQIFNAGKTWGNKSSSTSHGIRVAKRFWSTTTRSGPTNPQIITLSHSAAGNAPFTNQYALFKFGSGINTRYGWVQLSLSITDAGGTGTGLGPELTIVRYAYDDSGAQIAAGATSGVPEPGTLSMTGLAALALGAAGIRRWRGERVKAQAPVSA